MIDKLIKKKSNKTYKNKKGEEHFYYNYFLVLTNGKMIQIRCAFKDDNRALDTFAEFVK